MCVCLYGGLRNHPFKTIFEGLFIRHIFSPFLSNKRRKKKARKMLEWVNCYTSPCGLSDGARWERSHEQWLVIVCVCVHRQEKDPKIRVRGLFHFVLQETKKKKQKKRQKPQIKQSSIEVVCQLRKARGTAADTKVQQRERDRQTELFSAAAASQQVSGPFGKVKVDPYYIAITWIDSNTKNKANTRIIVTGANYHFKKFW